MNMMDTEKYANDRKRKIAKFAKFFFVIILLLTFFSKSLYSWTLPKVKAEDVLSGTLTKEIVGEGIVEAKGRIEYYSDVNAAVKDVKVSVGDAVKQGDIILTLDMEELEQDIQLKQIELKELQLSREKMLELNEENELYRYEENLKALEQAFAQKEKEYLYYKALYEAGAESQNSFELKESEYNIASLKLTNAKKELEMQKEKLTANSKNRQRDIEIMDLSIKRKELELKALELEKAKYIITAPHDGIIKELNYKKGMLTDSDLSVYVLDSVEQGMDFKVDMKSELSEYIDQGDNVQVFIKNKGNIEVNGTVRAIKEKKADSSTKTIYIELEEAGLTGGETGEMHLTKEIGSYNQLIPRSALYREGEGYYVYVLQEKEGPLGTEYYVVKQKVTIGDSNYEYTGVYSGLLGSERVVTYTSKDLSDGMQVILDK